MGVCHRCMLTEIKLSISNLTCCWVFTYMTAQENKSAFIFVQQNGAYSVYI